MKLFRNALTLESIKELLLKVDSFFRESVDSNLEVVAPSKYVIKTIVELHPESSYDAIWTVGERLSSNQLASFLLSKKTEYNFWDFQLFNVQSSSMCIIVFLNNYPEQEELGIHCAFPSIFSVSDSRGSEKKCVFLIVKSVIDQLDLYGLLESGAPEDEFDIETREIASRISSKNITSNQIAAVIADVFNKAFDLHDSPDVYFESAKKIKSLMS